MVPVFSGDPYGKWGAVAYKTFLPNAVCNAVPPPYPPKIHMVHNISRMKSKASQGRSLGGFWSQIARNKCAILILALKLPLLEWSQSHSLCSTAHLKVETRCFLVCFSSGKKKTHTHIRTLDEICNPSYTNLRSPRRCYNLIPKQAAKRGNSPGGEKKTFFSFLLPPLFEFLKCFPGFSTVYMGFAPSSSHHWEAAHTMEVALVQLLTLDLGTCISFQWCSSVWLRL